MTGRPRSAIALLTFALLVSGGIAGSQDRTASLFGRATVLVDGRPVPVRRAVVRLRSEADQLRTQTDTDGMFAFSRIHAGQVQLLVEKAGYVTAAGDHDRSMLVNLADGEARRLDVRLVRGAAIEGQLMTSLGGPATSVEVAVSSVGYGHLGRRAALVAETLTDDRGRFRLHTLPAGRYVLSAQVAAIDQTNRAWPFPDSALRLARSYFPGTPFLDQARTIDVTAGDERTGLDFVIRAVAVGAVSGTVADSTGRRATRFAVRMQAVGQYAGEVSGFSLPEASQFTYTAVPPGEYWLLATVAPASGDGAYEYAATRVSVAERAAETISVTTAPGEPVTGRVVFDDGTRVPGTLRVIAEETSIAMPHRPDVGPPMGEAIVAPDGTFRFPSLFGPHLFRVRGLPADAALVSVARAGRDVSNEPLDFVTGGSSAPLDIVLTSGTASIQGDVHDAAGMPSPGARVVAFAADPAEHRVSSRFIRTERAAIDGRYLIRGLLPGRYLVAAVEGLAPGAWEDAAMLQALTPAAATVQLGAGQRSEVALFLARSR